MLVLGRKEGESILIDFEKESVPSIVEIIILDLQKRKGRVCIGIKADTSIPIYRKEICGALKKEKNNEPA